jgi:hypothetical protein
MTAVKRPVTPDGRYFVVRGRLWRMANPALDDRERSVLVGRLMAARRAGRLLHGSAGAGRNEGNAALLLENPRPPQPR